MREIRLREAALSVRLFISLLLCVMGLSYLTLLGGIWIDTELKVSYVIEGYGSFESIELIEQSFKYIFWFICTFTITVSLLLMTSYPEKLKRCFAVVVPLFIISDTGSMWLVRYCSFFAWQLYASGMVLATCFFVMFLLIQYDLWLKKK